MTSEDLKDVFLALISMIGAVLSAYIAYKLRSVSHTMDETKTLVNGNVAREIETTRDAAYRKGLYDATSKIEKPKPE